MRANFDASLAAVLKTEAGYVNDPKDPGGATNRGVTQKVYNLWRADHGLPIQSVKLITPAEVFAIYKKQYWDRVRGDELPSGVDYCVFDFAVNSGVHKASCVLQEALLVDIDGKIGPNTLAEAKAQPAAPIIDCVCDLRQHFLEGLKTFGHFGKGWTARVKAVRAKAKGMA
jgi:lysozyme family protein